LLTEGLVHLTVVLGVLELQISLLDKGRDLFELVVGVVGVVHEDAVEDLGQVGVEVLGHVAANVVGFTELGPDALKCLLSHAHLFFLNQFELIKH